MRLNACFAASIVSMNEPAVSPNEPPSSAVAVRAGVAAGAAAVGGRAAARAEAAQAAAFKVVHHAFNQWRFRADDGQLDTVVPGEIRQAGEVHDIQCDVLDTGLGCAARIAGCHVNSVNPW